MENNVFYYNGNNITLKKENGNVYVNLTEVAKSFPEKNLSTIINSQEIKEYINRLSEIKNFSSVDLLKVTKGGDVSLQGTWAHQKVALRICQKLSTDFAIMVDTKIEELISQGYTTLDNINRKELARMILEQEEEKEKLQLLIEQKAQQLDESKEWYTIKRYAKDHKLNWRDINWRALKAISCEHGYEIKKIFDGNYGEVNLYHIDVFKIYLGIKIPA